MTVVAQDSQRPGAPPTTAPSRQPVDPRVWRVAVGMMCVFPLMGTLTERLGCRQVSTAGATLALAGTLPMLWMTRDHFSPALTVACMFVRGAGQGAIDIPSLSVACSAVPKERLPIATTAVNIVQRRGGPVATTIAAMVVALSATSLGASGPRAFTIAFVLLLGLQALTLGAASRLPAVVR